MIRSLEKISNKYDIVSYTSSLNSSNGICIRSNKRYFYKILEKNYALQEYNGYTMARKFIPCATLVDMDLSTPYGYFIYTYDESINFNKGLLHDYLENPLIKRDNFKIVFNEIMDIYISTFREKIQNFYSSSLNNFVINRVNLMMEWYKDSQLQIIGKNSKTILKDLVVKLSDFIRNYKPTLLHVTHGDPSDMNFTITPIFLDYTTFGYNPLELEFASFYLNLTFGGMYLFPKYHKNQYSLHQYPINNINISWDVKDGAYCDVHVDAKFNSKRIFAIKQLINCFRPYLCEELETVIFMLIFRMITIINITTFEEKDRVLILYLIDRLLNIIGSTNDLFENLLLSRNFEK